MVWNEVPPPHSPESRCESSINDQMGPAPPPLTLPEAKLELICERGSVFPSLHVASAALYTFLPLLQSSHRRDVLFYRLRLVGHSPSQDSIESRKLLFCAQRQHYMYSSVNEVNMLQKVLHVKQITF